MNEEKSKRKLRQNTDKCQWQCPTLGWFCPNYTWQMCVRQTKKNNLKLHRCVSLK